jgi:hypothetical protein
MAGELVGNLVGQTLTSHEIDLTVRLFFSNAYFVRIESPLHAACLPAARRPLRPEQGAPDGFLPTRELVNQVVSESSIDDKAG